MRITHVIQDLGLGGAESFVIELALAQRERGHDVDVLLVGRQPQLREVAGVQLAKINRRNGPDPFAVARVRKHLRATQSDVAHLHTAPGLLYGMLGAKAARTSCIVYTEHASSSPASLYGPRKRVLDLLAQRADCVITFDDHLRDIIVQRNGLDASKTAVIPNGVTVGSRRDLRQPSIDQVLVVMAVGGLRPQKNYLDLLRVAAQITSVSIESHVMQVRFEIVGEGPERPALEASISEHRITNVVLRGSVPYARSLFTDIDVFINTSTWEGMPIAMLEAMAESVPVIATRTGSVETLLGQAGLITNHDPSTIAQHLRVLLESPEHRAVLGRAGHDRARRHYDISMIADRHLELYKDLVSTKSRA